MTKTEIITIIMQEETIKKLMIEKDKYKRGYESLYDLNKKLWSKIRKLEGRGRSVLTDVNH